MSQAHTIGKRKWCPHCDQSVAKRTFNLHKQLYFNENVWQTERSDDTDGGVCSTLECEGKNGNCTSQIIDEDSKFPIVGNDDTEDVNALFRSIDLPIADIPSNEEEARTEEVWDDVNKEEICMDFFDKDESEHNMEKVDKQVVGIVRLYTTALAYWASVYNVSDACLKFILKFFILFCNVCATFMPFLKNIALELPNSVYKLNTRMGLRHHNFIKYVNCPTCRSIYSYTDCFDQQGAPKQCTFIKSANHKHKNKRIRCGSELMKRVTLKNGTVYYPRKVYCFRSLKQSLKELFARRDFVKLCSFWMNWNSVPGYYRDIYDGRLWKTFVRELNFPCQVGDLLLILNLDWFQPFDNSTYSVGVIYLAISNLPRAVRFKRENIIIVGILPGPSEPNCDQLCAYMEPLVDELNELWSEGMVCQTAEGNDIAVRVALLCCACDVPAARKLCGFLSHNAKMGCSKCKKKFVSGRFFVYLSICNYVIVRFLFM